MVSRRGFVAGALALLAAPGARAGDPGIWRRLRGGGYVLLMRHGSTEPGNGDPHGYRLDDCKTQRNLSEAGRAEARRVGDRFRAERVPVARVYTSPWCRCKETAMLAFGRAEEWDPLSSFFDVPDKEPEYTIRIRRRIAAYARVHPEGNLVLVTHNVNIAALSRVSVEPAELVVMRSTGCCDARAVERLRL